MGRDEGSHKADSAAAADRAKKADEPGAPQAQTARTAPGQTAPAPQPAASQTSAAPSQATAPAPQAAGQSAPAAPGTQPAAPQRTSRSTEVYDEKTYPKELDSGEEAGGILEVMPDGYGFIRCENYLPGENDVYVAPSQIRRFGLKTGDILRGNKRITTQQEKFSALLCIPPING